jgi:hypothetical protein
MRRSVDAMRRNPAQRRSKTAERFLSARADTFAGTNVKEKASARFVRNDGGYGWLKGERRRGRRVVCGRGADGEFGVLAEVGEGFH